MKMAKSPNHLSLSLFRFVFQFPSYDDGKGEDGHRCHPRLFFYFEGGGGQDIYESTRTPYLLDYVFNDFFSLEFNV